MSDKGEAREELANYIWPQLLHPPNEGLAQQAAQVVLYTLVRVRPDEHLRGPADLTEVEAANGEGVDEGGSQEGRAEADIRVLGEDARALDDDVGVAGGLDLVDQVAEQGGSATKRRGENR